MDFIEPPVFWIGFLTFGMFFVQLAWYVGVSFALWKIWCKVRHLPG